VTAAPTQTAVPVTVRTEQGESLEFLATPELMDAFRIAIRVSSEARDALSFDFQTLLVGLLSTQHGISRWLHSYVASWGDHLKSILTVDRTGRQPWLVSSAGPNERSSAAPWFVTTSVFDWLTFAHHFSTEQQHAWVGLRHVIGAVIFTPGFHDDDLQRWGLGRSHWGSAYLGYVGQELDRADLEFWQGVATRTGIVTATKTLDLTRVEHHVGDALKIANAFAGQESIDALHVVRAVLAVVAKPYSPSFTKLAQLVSLESSLRDRTTGAGALPSPERLSERLRAELTFAQSLPASSPSEQGQLWGRHLVTAALLSNEPRLAHALEATKSSLDAVQEKWYLFVTTDPHMHGTAPVWDALWDHAGVPRPGHRRAGYSTETDEGEDKLGIDNEARSFARLILDRNVNAPLSIGLLGDWGSGKSFFIEQIKLQIAALQRQKRPEFFENVIEIEFNAWHASDANLWASLVTYIFDEIWAKVSTDSALSPEQVQRALMEKLETARGAVDRVEGQVALARAAVGVAEKELQDRKDTLALSSMVESITTDELRKLAKSAGWHRQLQTITDVEQALHGLESSGQRLRSALTALLEMPVTRIAAPTAAITVATLALVFFIDHAERSWLSELTKWIAAAGGMIASLVAPLRLSANKLHGFSQKLEAVRTKYDEAVARTEKSAPEEFARLSRARRELGSAEASLTAAKERLGELLHQQAVLNPGRRLGAFLEERVQSTQYRSQQGIISLVHRDFRQLSKYMKELRNAAPGGPPSPIKPFDRIVLYVDDLDRCRPDHVVHMLEAVHLLLALDLFVVVVAVDSRWLTRALEVHYKDLLGTAAGREGDRLRMSTAHGYLEKIFQITYALGPMKNEHFGKYVESLTQVAPEPRSEPAQPVSGVEPVQPSSQRDPSQTPEPVEAIETNRGSRPDNPADPAVKPLSARPRTAAAPVRITEAEATLITSLGPLLPTPRIAKRLVNVYRLIRAGRNPAELDEFEQTGRATSCLFMLAILFGRPALGGRLMRMLQEGAEPFDAKKRTLIDAVELHGKAIESDPAMSEDSETWTALRCTLEALKCPLTVGEAAREPMEIARYSLVSGHDWHTWTRQAQDTTPIT
jgi:KAP family P-loop domain